MPCNQRVYDEVHTVLEDTHSPSKCYPTLAAGVDVTATNAGTTWTLGAVVEVVPKDTITSEFDIHSITIELADTATTYELVLYYDELDDGSDIECGRVRWTRVGAQVKSDRIILRTSGPSHIKLPANSSVNAKVATPNDNGEVLTISIEYHEY